jgi:hypothetical protein
MPAKARADMMELYASDLPARKVVQGQLARELLVPYYLGNNPERLIRDDKPYNEYFLMRKLFEAPQNTHGGPK